MNVQDAHASGLLTRLAVTLSEMERLAAEARSLLAQLNGPEAAPSQEDEAVAERTRRAVLAVKAKARAASLSARRNRS